MRARRERYDARLIAAVDDQEVGVARHPNAQNREEIVRKRQARGRGLRERAPLTLSIMALAVSVLGTTSVGEAAVKTVASSIPGFAKTAAYANQAGNASKLNGHVSSKTGLPGTIPVVGKNGKLPTTIVPAAAPVAAGSPGAQGPAGPTGATGPTGVSAYEIVSKNGTFTASSNNVANALADVVQCPTGKVALGGGGSSSLAVGNVAAGTADLVSSFPTASGQGWQVTYAKLDGTDFSTTEHLSYTTYVVCANVTK